MKSEFEILIRYAKARFGDAVHFDIRGDDAITDAVMVNREEAPEIEVIAVGEDFLVFAESFRFEPAVEGPEPALAVMDSIMTYGIVEFGTLVRTSVVASPETVRRYSRMPWRWERRRWVPWSGEIADRAELAREFELPDVSSPLETTSSVLFPRNKPRVVKG
ncbi:MAG: hypothetical protein KF772_01055 [Cryobacterium sp.]|nr:hypothetical protein [Cryobacterium sp.]